MRRLWAIDSSSQTFRAAITCFTYHESHAEDAINAQEGDSDLDQGLQLVNGDSAWTSKHFVPMLSIGGAIDQEWGAWHFMLSPERGPNGRRMLLGKNDALATIQQELPLTAFPFDVQGLEVSVNLDEDPSIAHLVPMRPAQANGSPDVADVAYNEINFPDLHFIEEVPHAQGIRTLRTLPPRTGAERLHGSMGSTQAYVCVPVARAAEHYLSTVGAVLLVISLCVCSTFVVPSANPSLRLCVDLGLLLLAVAVKLYLAQTLPLASYTTRLDRLALGLLVLLLAVLCAHALVFLVQMLSRDIAHWLDLISWLSILLGWAGFVVSWLLACQRIRADQHSRMRAHLRALGKQHGTEVNVAEGVRWPGAKTLGIRGVDAVRKGSPWRSSHTGSPSQGYRALSMV